MVLVGAQDELMDEMKKKTPQSFVTCSRENERKRRALKTVLMMGGRTDSSFSPAEDPFEKLISKMIEIR